MCQRLARLCLLIVLALGVAVPANTTPMPPPPPPRPFDDPLLASRFEDWQEPFLRSVDDAAAKLVAARSEFRTADEAAVPDGSAAKRAAREFALARKRSLERLRPLIILQAEMKPVTSTGDRQRVEETLNSWREWFNSTESNTIEILEAATK